jgi:hypothetical protein
METNNLADTGIEHSATERITLDWDSPELVRIIRIRFVGDTWSGPFDLSYCLGVDDEGRQVRVRIPTYQVWGGRNIVRQLVADAKRSGVYLRRLCDGPIDDVLSVCF